MMSSFDYCSQNVIRIRGEWATECAHRIASAVRHFVKLRGQCSLMLTGGVTVRPIYGVLASTPEMLEGKVKYYFGDERCVPPGHPDSNYGAACKVLFPDGIPREVSVHRMRGDDPDINAAAAHYESILPDQIDVLLLGVGEDGHIASLFPHGEAISEAKRKVVAVTSGGALHNRLTVTPRVIRRAKEVYVLAKGEAKGRVLAKASQDISSELSMPVKIALAAHWLVDEEAFTALSSTIRFEV